MRTIPASIAPDTFAGVVRGDRDAFHHLFDEYAPSLVESAGHETGGDVAAAHVIEHLFERAWQQRHDFLSPEALHDWLVRETHALSVREQARRAGLHRLESHEQAPHATATTTAHTDFDVAAGWSRLLHWIEQSDADPAAGAAQRFEASRHGAAEHIAHVGEGLPTARIIGGVVLVGVIAAAAWWGVDRAGADFKVTRALDDKDAHAITTTSGQRAIVKLDDGTKVMMGADANVVVPKTFNHDMRAVKLVGAARFTVAPNAKIPFVVRAGKMQVLATGTEFTVSNYDNEPVVVSVQQGSVTVTVGKNVREVASGSAIVLTAEGGLSVPTVAVRDAATGWADGRVMIANGTVRSSLPVFRRWYQYDLRPETKLLDRPVSLSAPVTSGDSALAELERVAHVKQIWLQKNMVLVDASSPAARAK